MKTIDLAIRLYDDSWSHAWESVSSALKGITDKEALWQHSCYADVESQPGFPPPGSILWHIAHIEHCARMYAHILRNRPVTTYPDLLPPKVSTLSELLRELDKGIKELREAIASLNDSSLGEPCLGEQSTAEFLGNVMRHHTWHAGSIIVGRRLYRQR